MISGLSFSGDVTPRIKKKIFQGISLSYRQNTELRNLHRSRDSEDHVPIPVP